MTKRQFMHGVATTLACDAQRAASVVDVVFQELRQRITEEEARHVAAQMPRDLARLWRGDGTRRAPAHEERDELVGRVRRNAVLPDDAEAERAVRAVFHQLQLLLGSPTGLDGEAWDVFSQLPRNLKRLWIDAGRHETSHPTEGR